MFALWVNGAPEKVGFPPPLLSWLRPWLWLMSLVNKFYGEGKNSQDPNQKSWLCQYPVCLITDCVAEKVMRSVMSVRPSVFNISLDPVDLDFFACILVKY